MSVSKPWEVYKMSNMIQYVLHSTYPRWTYRSSRALSRHSTLRTTSCTMGLWSVNALERCSANTHTPSHKYCHLVIHYKSLNWIPFHYKIIVIIIIIIIINIIIITTINLIFSIFATVNQCGVLLVLSTLFPYLLGFASTPGTAPSPSLHWKHRNQQLKG